MAVTDGTTDKAYKISYLALYGNVCQSLLERGQKSGDGPIPGGTSETTESKAVYVEEKL